MSSRKKSVRNLSTLPGWDQSAALLLAGRTVNEQDLRALGAWVPPMSIERVTLVLLRALALGVVRQKMQLDSANKLEAERQQKVISINLARLNRNRAAGKFGQEWFMNRNLGGDPTL